MVSGLSPFAPSMTISSRSSVSSVSRPASRLSDRSNSCASPPLGDDVPDLEPSLGPLPPRSDESYVLVIGGLGYIGSHTSLSLLKAGYNIIIVDDLSNSFTTVLSHITELAAAHCKEVGRQMPEVQFHKMDYKSPSMRLLLQLYSDMAVSEGEGAQMSRICRISAVVHFAAFKSVSESIQRPIPYYQNNISGLVGLLDALDQHNVRNFIFSSSATVYGSKANEGRRLREQDLVHFPETWTDENGCERLEEPSISGLTSPYGRSKYFGEAILADIARSDPRWSIAALRYFNPVGCESTGALGENPRQPPTNLFPVIGEVMTGRRETLPVLGTDWETRDGTAVRDYVHVVDIARGHVLAVSNVLAHTQAGAAGEKGAAFRAYNLGSGDGTTVLEAVRSMEAASQRKIKVDLVGRREGDVGLCIASNNRAHKELGWLPRESVEQCAADLWTCLKSRLPSIRG